MLWQILILMNFAIASYAEDPQHIQTISCVRALFGSALSTDPFVIKDAGKSTSIKSLKSEKMYALVADDFNVKAAEINPNGKVDYWLESKEDYNNQSGLRREIYRGQVEIRTQPKSSPFFMLVDTPFQGSSKIEPQTLRESEPRPKENAIILTPSETQLLISEYLTNHPIPDDDDDDEEILKSLEAKLKIPNKNSRFYFRGKLKDRSQNETKNSISQNDENIEWTQISRIHYMRIKKLYGKRALLKEYKPSASEAAIGNIKFANKQVEDRLQEIASCDNVTNKTVAKAGQMIKTKLLKVQQRLKDLTFEHAINPKNSDPKATQ